MKKTDEAQQFSFEQSCSPKQGFYFVGYLDILGYCDYFETNKVDETNKFLCAVKESIELAQSEIELKGKPITMDKESQFNPEIRVFSDNIVIAVKCKQTNIDNLVPFITLVYCLANIQRLFLTRYGLLLRGGLVKGLFYINKDFIFGKALIKAYEMENKKAVFPRIIIEKTEVKKLIEINNADINIEPRKFYISIFANIFIAMDSDNKYFINYLPLSRWTNGHPMVQVDIHNIFAPIKTRGIQFSLEQEPSDEETQLSEHKEALISKIKIFGTYDSLDTNKIEVRRKVMLKYLWATDYHNIICENALCPNQKIDYRMRTDPRTHLPIVEIESL